MKPGKLLILIAVTLVVVISAIFFWQDQAPQKSIEKQLLFSDLKSRINAVKIVEIKGYEEDVILSFQNQQWVVQSSDSFPAIPDKVRNLIINLAELKIDSEKTSRPELYERLSVEGPYERQSQSILVNLIDENGNLLESLIVGKRRESNDAIAAFYGRLPDEAQALLLLGELDVSAKDKDWFQRQIIDLAGEEIQSINITHPDGETFTLLREAQGEVNLKLKAIPEGKRPQSELILNSMANLLQDVRAEGVRSVEQFQLPEQIIQLEIKTFRGLDINVKLTAIDEKYYANFNFAYTALKDEVETSSETPTPEQEVEFLNAAMSAWVFEIQKFKYDDMTRRLDTLIRN